jgi:DNA adenine methylase
VKAEMDKPKIGAIAPWFGGKRNLASTIAAEIGPHTDYWEPFCGSMAMLFGKEPSRNETVNDLHGDLTNLAKVIQCNKGGPKLYRMLRRTLFCEAIHKEAQERLKTNPDCPIERAYCYFVKSWMGMSGIAGTQRAESKLCIRYTSTGGSPSTRFANAVASIPWWRRRLASVRILNRDGIQIIEKIPDVEGVAIYCDPPYLVKGASYAHDFSSDDHVRLAAALGRFKTARAVVSYYEHPDLATLYPDWYKVDLKARRALVCQSARDMEGVDAPAPEVLLINERPEPQATLF